MRTTWLAVCCAAAGGLVACGGDDGPSGYPSGVRDNFMRACRINGNETTCKCVLDKLEDTVPYEDFDRADAEVRAGGEASGETGRKIKQATQSCRRDDR